MSDADQHGASPLSSSAVPSSLDDEFFEESRFQKFARKLKQEPLIPVGCALTCYALWMATKSIRAGDHHQTNKMFRARIYAQGFTLIALVAGSVFYQDERMRRRKFEDRLEEKKAAEKREKWLNELEARDREDREWRERIERSSKAARETVGEVKERTGEMLQNAKERVEESLPMPGDVKAAEETARKGGWFGSKSVLEEVHIDGWGPGMWVRRTRDAWRRA
jgi:pyruvate/2-oxoacid:ferredoxin oxidoreductase beta subunit